MDTFTSGAVDAPINTGEVTAKETPESSQGTGQVTPENGTGQASESQDNAESGKAEDQQDRRRGPSKLDTIKELRAKIREQRSSYETQFGSLRSQLEELKGLVAKSGQGEKKPSKTFWEAPEEVLDERFDGKLSAMEQRLLERLDQRESQNQQTSEWRQETSDATKFIQSQKGITEDDHEDIADVIRSTPEMRGLTPMQRAKYGLYLWQQSKGIGDKSELKAQASTVIGTPPSPQGKKNWTDTEVNSRLEGEFGDNPKFWDKAKKDAFDAFSREIESAAKEGRLK